jgi:hypothetical protein
LPAAYLYDTDPQVDAIARFAVELAKDVRAKRLDGRFAVEFSATAGDIRAPREDRSKPLKMPQPKP